MIPTFGPIDWREYYKPRQKPVEFKATFPFPCSVCAQQGNCSLGVNPERRNRCGACVTWMDENWRNLCRYVLGAAQ